MADLLLCPLSYLYKFNHDHHGSSPYTGFSHIKKKRERRIYDGNIDNFPGCILFLHDLGGVLHCTAAAKVLFLVILFAGARHAPRDFLERFMLVVYLSINLLMKEMY